jgi:peptidoglycan-N-acetylmuramic acid deacetylase
MKTKLFVLCMVMGLILLAATGCGQHIDMMDLSDFGGIAAFSNGEHDFQEEISGRLSEDPEEIGVEESMEEAMQIPGDGEYSNRLLRWGIARSPENKPPRADPGAPELLVRYGGLYIGDTSQKNIYLTFDEGYENGYTGKILDVLRDNNAKAVFFITGPYLKDHQELVRRMVEEGHIVGNHTVHHPSLPEKNDSQLEEEILGLDRVFYEKFGSHMKYLRPPKGEYSERTLALTRKLGYCNMFWSLAYADWYRDKVRGPQYTYNIVTRNLHNGAVLLLHAVSRDNADALDMIIKGARGQGYEIGCVDDIAPNVQ